MIKGVPYDAEIAYLESTGTQWIDTGFKATGGALVEYRFRQADPTPDGYLFGSHNPANNSRNGYNRNQSGIASSTTCCFNKCDRFEEFTVPIIDTLAFHTIKYDNRQYTRIGWFDGALLVNQTTTSVLSPVNNVVVFYSQYYGDRTVASGAIAWAKIWDVNGTLVRDYIPVRVGTVGYLYDRVSRRLFGNAGTGAFTLGPDVATPVMSLHRMAERGVA